MIGWTIAAALDADVFHGVYVSTEDPEIANAALTLGAQVIDRPRHLAGDESETIDAVRHAVNVAQQAHVRPVTAAMTLQPTNPLRTAEDIRKAANVFAAGHYDSVLSLVDTGETHPARMCTIPARGALKWLNPDAAWLPRQQLPTVFLRDGSIYLTSRALIDDRQIVGGRIGVVEIDPGRSLRVDTIDDLHSAETLLR